MVWRDAVRARIATAAPGYLCAFLGQPVQLAHLHDVEARPVDPAIFRAISKPGSATSSLTIIICDTTRASPISLRPMSTSDEAKPSCLKMRQILLSISPEIVPNVLTTDTLVPDPLDPGGPRTAITGRLPVAGLPRFANDFVLLITTRCISGRSPRRVERWARMIGTAPSITCPRCGLTS